MDLESHPEKAEHFGIAPVEAMSTGCIPILFGIGGTAELVEEGTSGFTFLDSAELIAKTFKVVNSDSHTLDRLRENAKTRANLFSKQRFNSEFRELMKQIANSLEN
jgi:glycosyltransferase involved in cell wall biosynthesis